MDRTIDKSIDRYVLAVAKEIQNYLLNHPNAADSAEGVMRWWLSQQRFEESIKVVQQALDLLVAKGDVDRAITPGCQTVYFNAKEHNAKEQVSKNISSDSLN